MACPAVEFRRYKSSDLSKYRLGGKFYEGKIVALEPSTSTLVVAGGKRIDGRPIEWNACQEYSLVVDDKPTWAATTPLTAPGREQDDGVEFRRYKSSDVSKYQVGAGFSGGTVVALEPACYPSGIPRVDHRPGILVIAGGKRKDGTPVGCRRESSRFSDFQLGERIPIFTADGWKQITPVALDRDKGLVYYDVNQTTGAELCFGATTDYTAAEIPAVKWAVEESEEVVPAAQPARRGSLNAIIDQNLNTTDKKEKKKKSGRVLGGLSSAMLGIGLVADDEEPARKIELGLPDARDVKYRGCAGIELRTLMEDVFEMLDFSGDGTISFSETMQALGNYGGAASLNHTIEMAKSEQEDEADNMINYNEWRDYWESTASGETEMKAIKLLSGMMTHLKHDTEIIEGQSAHMTLGYVT